MGGAKFDRLAALAAILSAGVGPRSRPAGNPRRHNWLRGATSYPGPINRHQERARRRRQIESGMLKLGPEGGKPDWGSS